MKQLLTINQHDIDPTILQKDVSGFGARSAARAVLLDAEGSVYLLHVRKHGYHKLPGGGIDDGEGIIEALERELLEEVGCRAEVMAELGSIVEYREYDDSGLKQTSYCYLAKQIGDQQASALEEGELEEGMVEVKAASIDAAIALLQQDNPDNTEGKFIQKRDLCFLHAAKRAVEATPLT